MCCVQRPVITAEREANALFFKKKTKVLWRSRRYGRVQQNETSAQRYVDMLHARGTCLWGLARSFYLDLEAEEVVAAAVDAAAAAGAAAADTLPAATSLASFRRLRSM